MLALKILRWGGLLAWLGVAACGSSAPPEPQTGKEGDPCHDADIAGKRVWNDETRVNVKGQVMQWGGEIGVDVAQARAEEITSSMDHLSDDWARMRKAVCKDHFTRHTLTKDEYQARVDCLDRLLTRQRTYLSSLSSPQADGGTQLAALNTELESCR
jgi:hypothetical protein